MLAITASAAITTQTWSLGWDQFAEPLNLTKSNIKWSVSSSRKLTVTFAFVGARPTKLYQISIISFAARFLQPLANFPLMVGDLPGGLSIARPLWNRDDDHRTLTLLLAVFVICARPICHERICRARWLEK